MLQKHIFKLGVISSLLIIVGLILMFSSVTFGTSLGESWLINQENSIADTSHYLMIIETYTNTFLISGSILFAAGFLTAILTYFTCLFFSTRESKIAPENNINGTISNQ